MPGEGIPAWRFQPSAEGSKFDGGPFLLMNKLHLIAAVIVCGLGAPALADPVNVAAAENVYGDLARQIGGANVAVTSILSNPDEDPHLFEASPGTAKAIADARIVIVNGAGYDPWMEKLIGAHQSLGREEIRVSKLTGRKAGDNPHLWYDPAAMKAAARALAAELGAVDPAHKADYEQGEMKFIDSLKPLDDKIATMRDSYAGQPVAASEPVFGYQAALIGLKVRDEKYALAIQNNAEPTPSEVAGFENDLKGKKVKAMLYNAQASEPAVARLVELAKANGIPVVGVSETEPRGSTYQEWMMGQLNALDRALAGGA
jgi:zinc/manganese transport system substrate-binding protein